MQIFRPMFNVTQRVIVKSSSSGQDLHGLDRLGRLLGLLHYRSAAINSGGQTALFEDYIFALRTLFLRTPTETSNVSVIDGTMLSAYVLQNNRISSDASPDNPQISM